MSKQGIGRHTLRALPQVTAPYPQVKSKLHQYAIGTALAARELATFTGMKPYDAYVLGMLSNLGRCALIKLYFGLFDQIQRRQLLESQRNKQRQKHRFIEKQHAKQAPCTRSFSTGAVDRLKAIDIFTLPMIREQERTRPTTSRLAANKK